MSFSLATVTIGAAALVLLVAFVVVCIQSMTADRPAELGSAAFRKAHFSVWIGSDY